MKKGTVMAAAAVCAAVVLGGCGKKEAPLCSVLVVSGDADEAESQANDAITRGMAAYASENGYRSEVFTAATGSGEALDDQFAEAVDEKAMYIFAAGSDMEEAVYRAQGKGEDARFVIFEGAPRVSEEYEAQIGSNTVSVMFDRGDLGFLTGYAAVRNGYRSLAYIAGEETDESVNAYNGFVSGAAYAASELGVSDSVTVFHENAGTDELTPRRMTDALSLYGSGVELIATDVPEIAEAVVEAAAQEDGAVATVGFDGRAGSDLVVFAAVPEYEETTEVLLQSFDQNNGFTGGKTVLCGAKANAVGLSADYGSLASLTEDEIAGALEDLKSGAASVGNPAASGISIEEASPVAGDPEAGVNGVIDSESEAAEEAESGSLSAENSADGS